MMTPDDPAKHDRVPALPHAVKPAANVPVFNCHVYLSPPNSNGQVTARMATLPEMAASGQGDREALRNLVQSFKQFAKNRLDRGESIPWHSEPLPLSPGDQQRWVPVHL